MRSGSWSPPETPLLDLARARALERLPRGQDDPRCLSERDQIVLAVTSAQSVIDNGGFRYFFENDWPGQPPYSFFSAAYRMIGAEMPAECIDRAVALFPFAQPEQHEEKRRRFLQALPDAHEVIELGHRVCGDTSVWELLESYVKDHPEGRK